MPLGDSLAGFPNLRTPELVIPASVSEARMTQALTAFCLGIPFAPPDLKPGNLLIRMQKVFLPTWLVDCRVAATWRAEAGFDYEVVSHQDHFSGGKWISKQVKEGRIRWESRLGRLDRRYSNVPAAALEGGKEMFQLLGEFSTAQAQGYEPAMLHNASLRLPDRSTTDAWSEAEVALRSRAAEECRMATSAGHLRSFGWEPGYSEQNWTLLLLPVFSAFYLDEAGSPIPVYFHGQSGQAAGTRRASIKRAKRASLALFLISATVFLLSLLAAGLSAILPALLALAVVGFSAALLVGAASIYPLAAVWWFNRTQQPVSL